MCFTPVVRAIGVHTYRSIRTTSLTPLQPDYRIIGRDNPWLLVGQSSLINLTYECRTNMAAWLHTWLHGWTHMAACMAGHMAGHTWLHSWTHGCMHGWTHMAAWLDTWLDTHGCMAGHMAGHMAPPVGHIIT